MLPAVETTGRQTRWETWDYVSPDERVREFRWALEVEVRVTITSTGGRP